MQFPDPFLEKRFLDWYSQLPLNKKIAASGAQIPSPDDPEHYYDFRQAFLSEQNSDVLSGHLTSEFKKMGHPRTFLGGEDTTVWHPDESNALSDLLGRVGTDAPNAENPLYNSTLKQKKKKLSDFLF